MVLQSVRSERFLTEATEARILEKGAGVDFVPESLCNPAEVHAEDQTLVTRNALA